MVKTNYAVSGVDLAEKYASNLGIIKYTGTSSGGAFPQATRFTTVQNKTLDETFYFAYSGYFWMTNNREDVPFCDGSGNKIKLLPIGCVPGAYWFGNGVVTATTGCDGSKIIGRYTYSKTSGENWYTHYLQRTDEALSFYSSHLTPPQSQQLIWRKTKTDFEYLGYTSIPKVFTLLVTGAGGGGSASGFATHQGVYQHHPGKPGGGGACGILIADLGESTHNTLWFYMGAGGDGGASKYGSGVNGADMYVSLSSDASTSSNSIIFGGGKGGTSTAAGDGGTKSGLSSLTQSGKTVVKVIGSHAGAAGDADRGIFYSDDIAPLSCSSQITVTAVTKGGLSSGYGCGGAGGSKPTDSSKGTINSGHAGDPCGIYVIF